jgi:hypothetical protein
MSLGNDSVLISKLVIGLVVLMSDFLGCSRIELIAWGSAVRDETILSLVGSVTNSCSVIATGRFVELFSSFACTLISSEPSSRFESANAGLFTDNMVVTMGLALVGEISTWALLLVSGTFCTDKLGKLEISGVISSAISLFVTGGNADVDCV